jgi:hypothetical protein
VLVQGSKVAQLLLCEKKTKKLMSFGYKNKKEEKHIPWHGAWTGDLRQRQHSSNRN